MSERRVRAQAGLALGGAVVGFALDVAWWAAWGGRVPFPRMLLDALAGRGGPWALPILGIWAFCLVALGGLAYGGLVLRKDPRRGNRIVLGSSVVLLFWGFSIVFWVNLVPGALGLLAWCLREAPPESAAAT